VLAAPGAEADLLVIGARGRKHARLPGGHTLQRVLDAASCSADVCTGDDSGS
jgi:nucleotide-binding universal stress UspA family protein